MQQTLKITSIGEAEAKADLIILSIDFATLRKDYDKALEISNDYLSELQNVIVNHRFKKTDLKTVDFHINAQYETYYD